MSKSYDELFQEQLEIEASYKDLAEEIIKSNFAKTKADGGATELSIGQRLIDREFDNVIHNVKQFVIHTLTPRPGVKPAYHGILCDLSEIYKDQEEHLYMLLAFTTFSTLLNAAFRKEFRLSNLAQAIGNELQNEAKMEKYIQEHPEHSGSVLKGINKRVDKPYKIYYAAKRMEYDGFHWTSWPSQPSMHLGAKLIELVMDGCGYFEVYNEITSKGNSVTEIRPTQWLLDTWAKNESNLIAKAFRWCPTVIPPAPWEDLKTGGYHGVLRNSIMLLRLHDINGAGSNTFSREYLNRLNQLELSEVREAINSIQATPWRINTKVLDVLKQIIARGGDIGGVPAMEPLPELPRLPEGHTEEELKAHKQKAVERIRLESRRKSKAIRTLGHLKVAERFAKYENIYFPHNMDFRGRVYPIPSFNPQGDDINKGLILFSNPPACQSMVDIGWLMVHGANLAGVDKVSYDDRKQWVLDNEERILHCANDPMGDFWWADQDEPFQFLSFCFEWKRWKAYYNENGTAVGFICGIAVAFDGTCSGLQHFSAILRDPIGGKAVNLLPADKPQDIYGLVAAKVNEQLNKDAIKGTPDEQREGKNGSYLAFGTKSLAQQWLTYGVNRKVTKRSVMTLAYGSKEYGFREQILEDIISPAKLEGRGEMFINEFQAAGYMAKLIWRAVKVVVVKAVEGMEWLQKMARLVCKQGRVVTWVTPLGLPVQQGYMVWEPDVFQMRFGGSVKRLYNYKQTGDVDKRSQASGIAPNFIHSMDASHLQLTINLAKQAGINHFAMIHDSYGSPVAQVDLMYTMVREAFIKMYSEHDVLANFQADMEVYIDKGDKIPEVPAKGTLNLETVRDSQYCFA